MKVNLESDNPDIRIEIVPLIDVIFCILTFFILAAVGLTRQQAINVDIPKASTGVAQLRELLVVSIDPGGQLYLEKQPVNSEQLYQNLLAYVRTNPTGTIVLNASQNTSYNQVVEVLDLLRSVGGDRVALATQPADQPVLTPQNPNVLPVPSIIDPNTGLPTTPQSPSLNTPGTSTTPAPPNQPQNQSPNQTSNPTAPGSTATTPLPQAPLLPIPSPQPNQ